MAKPYVFVPDSNQPEETTYEECKSYCRCNIKLSELRRLYRDSVLEITGNKDATAETLKQLSSDSPHRQFEPMELIVNLYNQYFFDSWETCLSRKKHPVDCIYGCYSGITDKEQPRPHPHESRVFKFFPDALPTMAERVESSVYSQIFTKFNDIIEYLEDLKNQNEQKAVGFGLLSRYDAALRLAWHSENRENLLPEKVHLHNGTFKGAAALLRLGQISTSEELKSGETELSVKCFPVEFHKLPAHHIENLLCIFHPIFAMWSPEPEKNKKSH